MKRDKLSTILLTIGAPFATLPFYLLAIRPRLTRWGATAVEVAGPWPGDELIPHPAFSSTRAITVHAPATTIWPWLVQIGQDRAGTYSYNLLENLLGVDSLNIEWLVPRFQEIAVGDPIQMPMPARFGGRGPGIVLVLQPEQALVLGHGEGRRLAAATRAIWAFLLSPLAAGSTRFIIRTRISSHLSLWEQAVGLLLEPVHFLMERQMLLRIKALAEESARPGQGEGPASLSAPTRFRAPAPRMRPPPGAGK